jgi:hypothetical protein
METQNEQYIITLKNIYNMSEYQFLDFCWYVNKQNPKKNNLKECIQNAKIWTNINHLGCKYNSILENKLVKLFS